MSDDSIKPDDSGWTDLDITARFLDADAAAAFAWCCATADATTGDHSTAAGSLTLAGYRVRVTASSGADLDEPTASLWIGENELFLSGALDPARLAGAGGVESHPRRRSPGSHRICGLRSCRSVSPRSRHGCLGLANGVAMARTASRRVVDGGMTSRD